MKKRQEKPENSERWLLTYSDLITLLMALFVILYASSNVDSKKYKQLSDSFRQAFYVSGIFENSGPKGEDVIDGESGPVIDSTLGEETEEEKLEDVKAQVDKIVENSDLKGRITTSIEERGLSISFSDNVFFDTGQAILKEDFKNDLMSISKVLNEMDNYIRIEGHTDNVIISNELYHSNWQLSSIRASNVAEFLVNDGNINPNRVSAVGYGEYRPLQSNDSEDGRAQNRRVDIVILNSKYNVSETNS